MEVIFTKKKAIAVRFSIVKRKLKSFLCSFCNFIFLLPRLIYNFLSWFWTHLYYFVYENADKIHSFLKKWITRLTVAFLIGNLGYNIYLYYINTEVNYYTICNKYFWINVAIILGYYLIYYFCKIYHKFFGIYFYLKLQQQMSEEFIINKLPHILKIFGRTRVGKDTFMAGATSVLVRHFKKMTERDLITIKRRCYIFDFYKIDSSIEIHYKKLTSSSKEKIKKEFFQLMYKNKGFIKEHYLKNKIDMQLIMKDYYDFNTNPIMYEGQYCTGVGVGKKHFIDLLLEYINHYIRKYVEINYTVFNQPFVEDLDTGLTSKIFSTHYVSTKDIEVPVKLKVDDKKIKHKSIVLYPHKNRMIIGETECGTWYLNVDSSINKLIKDMGARDFKAYQGHLIQDLYWFQVDQESDRTNKLIRALDHGYCGIVYREEIPGGIKRNIILRIRIWFIQQYINRCEKRIENHSYSIRNKQNKVKDLKNLYVSTSNVKYKYKYIKLEKLLRKKKIYAHYEKSRKRVEVLTRKIEKNKKDGYVLQTVVISESGTIPSEINPVSLKTILNDKKLRFKNIYTFDIVHKTSDVERYDTHYMKNLGEDRASKSLIDYSQMPNWPTNMKMTKNEILLMGYEAAAKMFDVSEAEYNEMVFGDLIEKYKIEPKFKKN